MSVAAKAGWLLNASPQPVESVSDRSVSTLFNPVQNTMIRRVAAMPGDELVAFEGEDHEETFVVPQVR